MSNLTIIKIIHTVIWIFFNVILVYMAFAVVVNKIDKYVWIGIGFIVVEGIVLLIFRMVCPLTILARRYSTSTTDNFDIYIPNCLAKYNKLIYTIFFVIIVCGLIYRMTNNEK